MGQVIIAGAGRSTTPSNLPPVGTSLNDMTWEEVRAISDAGLAADYFAIGDRKAITLNGKVGSLTLSNKMYYAYIIGINHNASIEGNCIHFQFGFTTLNDGVNIAFVDSAYDSNKTSGSWFNMNNSNSNSGGWKSSRMRTVICPAFKSVLPTDLQAILKTVTKYTNNTGGGADMASYVTTTEDEIFLLAEYELFGVREHAVSAEQTYQKQYEYYATGNSKQKYKHNSTGDGTLWWIRSVYYNSTNNFCLMTPYSDNPSNYNAHWSYGFAPAFAV